MLDDEDLSKFVALETGHNEFHLIPQPPGWELDGTKRRRILVDGLNYEHVWETPRGIWVYRRM